MLFHEEERDTVWLLHHYCDDHPDAVLRFEFSDNETYLASFNTSYESGNWYEVDEGIEDEEDEFFEIAFDVVRIIQAGPHKNPDYDSLLITYRNFPEKIIDSENGDTVYDSGDSN